MLPVINETELRQWNELREHGDGRQIASKEKRITANHITHAFQLGRARLDVQAEMRKYYAQKLLANKTVKTKPV